MGASVVPLVLALLGVLTLLAFVALIAWSVGWHVVPHRAAHDEDRRPAQPGKLDEEVEIVIAVASYLAVEEGMHQLECAHLVRAALCNERARACFHGRDEELAALRAELSRHDPSEPDSVSMAEGSPEDLRCAPSVVKAFGMAGLLAGPRGVTLGCLVGEMRLLDPMLRKRLPQEIRSIDDQEPLQGEYVYILNDARSSPMAVVSLLSEVFAEHRDCAIYLTLTVHNRGVARVGPMSAVDAETLMARARAVADAAGLRSLCLSRVAPDTTSWVMTAQGKLPPDGAGRTSTAHPGIAGADDKPAAGENPAVVEATDEAFAAFEDDRAKLGDGSAEA